MTKAACAFPTKNDYLLCMALVEVEEFLHCLFQSRMNPAILLQFVIVHLKKNQMRTRGNDWNKKLTIQKNFHSLLIGSFRDTFMIFMTQSFYCFKTKNWWQILVFFGCFRIKDYVMKIKYLSPFFVQETAQMRNVNRKTVCVKCGNRWDYVKSDPKLWASIVRRPVDIVVSYFCC